MDVIEAIHDRRSIRAYAVDSVPRPLIEELLWAAVQAPSPPVSGEAPWALFVMEGAELISGYGARALRYARENQPPGRPWTWADRPGFQVFWGAPAVVFICAKSGNRETPFDCCRAGQNLMLAAHARGLGSCWVGAPLPWLRSPGIVEELGLPQGYEPEVVVTLGYAKESPSGSPRPRPSIAWFNPVRRGIQK